MSNLSPVIQRTILGVTRLARLEGGHEDQTPTLHLKPVKQLQLKAVWGEHIKHFPQPQPETQRIDPQRGIVCWAHAEP